MSRLIDLTGKRFGKLLVIKRADNLTKRNGGIIVRWECRCDCGNTSFVTSANLIHHGTKSCGCSNFCDLTGKRFGELTVLERAKSKKTPSGKSRTMWRCKCDCGKESIVDASSLKRGTTTTCGTHKSVKNINAHKTHGMSRTRIYTEWIAMKSRFYNSSSPDFSRYGGRGITVCDEWLHDFQAFYDWAMANGYAEDLSIDRIDVNGNYEPSNCRWADDELQSNNKRNNRFFEHNGQIKTINQWSREFGINRNTLYSRIEKYKWGIEEALTIPPNGKPKKEKKKKDKKKIDRSKKSNRKCSHCENYNKKLEYCKLLNTEKKYWHICNNFSWKEGI